MSRVERAHVAGVRRHVVAAYASLTRPFTLMMPALGMLTGGTIALGAHPDKPSELPSLLDNVWLRIAVGTVMAAVLNAASNALNQVYDLEIDRINKPDRPLPRGELSSSQALRFSLALYVAAVVLSALVGFTCAGIVLFTAFATWAYSAPPLRLKRFLFWSNLTVSIPRGMLLKVAGWSAVGSIASRELWFIAFTFGVFVFGAVSTKDFSDVEGDRRHGCVTLPIRYGPRTARSSSLPSSFSRARSSSPASPWSGSAGAAPSSSRSPASSCSGERTWRASCSISRTLSWRMTTRPAGHTCT
jgi:4-hydroxybenzoate polyprenyltransferase